MDREMTEKIAKLKKITTIEEYRAFAKEIGKDLSEEEAEKEFRLVRERLSPENKDLDDEELQAINGGFGLPACPKNAYKGRCHDSVAAGSFCWVNDACFLVLHLYDVSDFFG